MFDLCVVGAGLIGSAAAKHASRSSSVCLVGPDEPTGKVSSISTENGGFIFRELNICGNYEFKDEYKCTMLSYMYIHACILVLLLICNKVH